MNAGKSGFYVGDVVIEELGESPEDFEECRLAFRTPFMPEDFVEEALCDDAAENW
jgi:hypothetical protein